MSIESIAEKIVNDAKEYADGLISVANQEAESIIIKAKEEAKAHKTQMAERATEEVVSIRHKRHAAAELEARKLRLAAKQKALANAMEAAIDQLAEMAPNEYIAFLAERIAETDVKEGQLLLNAKDKAAIGEKLVQTANKSLKGGKLTLSDQTMNARGGFVLKTGAVEINSTLETMVYAAKESVTPMVLEALFHEHEGRYEKV